MCCALSHNLSNSNRAVSNTVLSIKVQYLKTVLPTIFLVGNISGSKSKYSQTMLCFKSYLAGISIFFDLKQLI